MMWEIWRLRDDVQYLTGELEWVVDDWRKQCSTVRDLTEEINYACMCLNQERQRLAQELKRKEELSNE